jgi:hypothetical protein
MKLKSRADSRTAAAAVAQLEQGLRAVAVELVHQELERLRGARIAAMARENPLASPTVSQPAQRGSWTSMPPLSRWSARPPRRLVASPRSSAASQSTAVVPRYLRPW